ncbi:T9SS type A sorting domain-containing protein [Winogradskyella schleiferi]|uniref:T9SS type A sorting domain-containing protein n=1 Tax=Winogradskyella schleiferi TaxID=2686078 RepID=UPI0015BFE1D5|nr:T9SS type A sorting domain-containing protein [Winogradskyella schleiferi]
MQKKLFTILVVTIGLNTYSQIDFQPVLVVENINSIHSLNSTFASDLDGDGDLDLLSAARWNDRISWYENMNGLGLYGEEQVLSYDADGASSVVAADIDNDGDNDVLSSSQYDNKIAWYENIDGQGTFGSPQVISTNAMNALRVSTADLDGDGDLDVLSASFDDAKIAWYENTDGLGTFGPEQIIIIADYSAEFVLPVDIDNDGDIDVLTSTRGTDGKLAWHENTDGEGTFDVEHIIYMGDWVSSSISAKDLNGDGFLDVLATSRVDVVFWHANLDGLGNFGEAQIITTDTDSASFVAAEDIDNDGDMDVFSTSSYDSKVAWYENLDGLGNFGIQQIISDSQGSPEEVHLFDINGDGDLDVLAVSGGDNRIVWYTNNGLQSNEINGFVRLDLDNNGCELSDLSIPNLMVTTTDATNSYSTFTQNNGSYQLFPFEGELTTAIVSSLPEYYSSNPNNYTHNFTDVGNEIVADFCLLPTMEINDLSVSVYPLNDPRPGFDISFHLVYKNLGTTQISGDVVYEYDDSMIQFLSASQSAFSQTVNSVTFQFENLSPFEIRTIDLDFNIFPPPTVEIDDILNSTIAINPVSDDTAPEDNVFNLTQRVIGSFDPNDIAVLEGEEIILEDVDKYLHYLIRFQNTGTASAINVSVNNILDPKLDFTTMQLESLSHECRVIITNDNIVDFVFDDINLIDSTTDEPNSHGFITYKIKPKNDVVLGDVFNNSADIYFDFNEAITTNTVSTEIVNNLSIEEYVSTTIQLYPNPTNGILNIISNNEVSDITIYNELGQIVFSQKNKNVLDISKLATGIYYLRISDKNGFSEIKKIIWK